MEVLRYHFLNKLILLWPLLTSSQLFAQEIILTGEEADRDVQIDTVLEQQQDLITYPAAFFNRYRPNSALDMVEQIPGFRINDGTDQRGYSSTAGNILINNRRPGTKQDRPSDILSRIPASQVDCIELIRSSVRNIEMLGVPQIANVRLLEEVEAIIRWEGTVARNFDYGGTPLEGNISMADTWRDIEFNTGMDIQRFVRSDQGSERLLDNTGVLTEERVEQGVDKGIETGMNFNATTLLGETLFRFNSEFGYETADENSTSDRLPLIASEVHHTDLFDDTSEELQYEMGISAERLIQPDFPGKFIMLYIREDEDSSSIQQTITEAGEISRTRSKDSDQLESEAIARIELEWSGWSEHNVRGNFEFSYNVLDNNEVETEDTGSGPDIVVVPGANTRVEELRGDFLLKDIWSSGNLELDYGLGAEVSKLSQSGDDTKERNFFFFKPHTVLTYTHNHSHQTRFRVAREIAQLDFSDFVSSTDFEDDDISLGNPDLRPDKSWIAEASYEWRFNSDGVLKVTGFYHWISDVLDLLPITDTEEAPGNIGNGKRWGLAIENTLPLQGIGFNGARLDLILQWQDSTVFDPVTGNPRVLSAGSGEFVGDPNVQSESEYAMSVNFRQDLVARDFAWGWEMELQTDEKRFKVDELEVRDEGLELDFFIETTRITGLKIRLELNNLINPVETRNRIIYAGQRELSSVSRRRLQSETDGREIALSLSGTF